MKFKPTYPTKTPFGLHTLGKFFFHALHWKIIALILILILNNTIFLGNIHLYIFVVCLTLILLSQKLKISDPFAKLKITQIINSIFTAHLILPYCYYNYLKATIISVIFDVGIMSLMSLIHFIIKFSPLLETIDKLILPIRKLNFFLARAFRMDFAVEIMLEIARSEIINYNFNAAESLLNSAIDECEQNGESQIQGNGRNMLCMLFLITGRYGEVIEHSNQILKIASNYNDLELKRSAYQNIGNANEKLGTEYYSQAKDFYEKALEIDILLENKKYQSSDYNNLGNILESLKEFESAVNMYQKALVIFLELKDRSGECTIYTNLGALYQSINNFKEAIKYQNKCLKLSQEIKDEKSETNACLNLGYCYFAIDDFQTALNFFQATLAISQKIRDRLREVKALKGSADCYLTLNNPEKAKFYYQQTIPHLEIMQYGLSVKQRRSLIKQYLNIYQGLVDACIKTGDFNAAFFYAETSRNRYLVERIAKHDAPLPENLPINLSKQIETAKLLERNTLQAYTDGLSKNLEQDQITELSIKWSEAKRILENLYSQVVDIDPEFIAKTKVYPISFTEVQSLLPPATAILEFFFTENRLVTMLILPGAEAPVIPEDLCLIVKHIYLESIAKAWISDIAAETASKKDGGIEEAIQDLPARIDRISELLKFNNLLDYIPPEIKHLIVVPHNYLHLFPIHALWINESQRLIDRFSVEYTPSLLIWKICYSRQRNHWRFIGIENPTQDKDLIFAHAEIASISESRYFVDAQVLSGDQASKSAILEAAGCNEGFHFSGHAEYNFENPFDSYLMLSDNSDDNLTLSTILADMSMPQADLVTLSACCTGVVDAFQPTEAYLGLPTGFLLAGAKAVVSSLWKVNSIATAFLLDEFYRQLEETYNKAVALQNAQNWLRDCTADKLRERANTWDLSKLESKELFRLKQALKRLEGIPFENPYYWAAFILTGC